MSKLTKTQWTEARTKWERSKKEGFQWLADVVVQPFLNAPKLKIGLKKLR